MLYRVVLQDVTIGGNWIKDACLLSALFLTTAHVHLQLSQNKKFILKNGVCGLCRICFGQHRPRAPCSPQLSAPHWSSVGPWLLWLSMGVTNLLPFCFCHPELVVAQQEGPHSLADLGLDAPVVDKAQQLLLLVTLWWGGRRAEGVVNRKPGADSATGSSAFQS